jgi:uncharacterized protein involved in outer membrane biogenesis
MRPTHTAHIRSTTLANVLRATAAVSAFLVLLYAVAGFFVLPALLRPHAIETARNRTGYEVEIEDLSINPFTLSVRVEGLVVRDQGQAPMIALESMYADFEAVRSLAGRALVFEEIRLSRPFIALKRDRDGSINLEPLFRSAAGTESSMPERPPAIIVGHIAITHGRVEFHDISHSKPFQETMDSLNIVLHGVTTRLNEKGTYSLEASTDRGEILRWNGDLSILPLKSSGTIELSGIRLGTLTDFLQSTVGFVVEEGTAGVTGRYTGELTGGRMTLRIEDGRVNGGNLRCTDPTDDLNEVRVERFALEGIRADYALRSVDIANITVSSLQAGTSIDSAFQVGIRHMLTPPVTAAFPHRKATAPETPWKIGINRIRLDHASLRVTDASFTDPIVTRIDSLNVVVENVKYSTPPKSTLYARGVLNSSGTIDVEGTAGIDPLEGRLSVSAAGVQLMPLFPYLTRMESGQLVFGGITVEMRPLKSSDRIRLRSASASLRGTLSFASKGKEPHIEFRGAAGTGEVLLTDDSFKQDFLRLHRSDVRGIVYRSASRELAIEEIALDSPRFQVVLGRDGITNIQRILGSRPDAVPGVLSPPAMRIVLNSVSVTGASAVYSDLSLSTDSAITVSGLNVKAKTTECDEQPRNDTKDDGRTEHSIQTNSRGHANFREGKTCTDITVSNHGIDLTDFSPLFGEYAGYRIRGGTLNLDFHYQVAEQQLAGKHRIIIDQLTLGEEVRGPDVTPLPVKLGIALLKDSRNVIDLDIPVAGDLNHPDFSLFPVILRAFTAAIASPFESIGSLFGGTGESLQHVEFQGGTATLSKDEETSLDTLAMGMGVRPSLTLLVPGVASPPIDRPGLARRAIWRRVRQGNYDGTDMTPDQQRELFALYHRTFGEDADSRVPAIDSTGRRLLPAERDAAVTEACLIRITEAETVTEEDLRRLAQQRSLAIKDRLVLKGGVQERRIIVQDPDINATSYSGLIRLEMKLDAK